MTEPTVTLSPDKPIRSGTRRWPLALGALFCVVAGVLVAVLVTSGSIRGADPGRATPGPAGADTPSEDPPRPASAWFALDDFERPAVRNGLGTAAVGGKWAILGRDGERRDFAVEGGSAVFTLPKRGAGRSAYLGQVEQDSSDLLLSFSLADLPRGGPLYVYAYGRRIADYSAYVADVYIDPRGRVRLSLTAYLSAQDGLTLSERAWLGVIGAGETVHLRVQTFRVKPTQVRAKLWIGDAAEPEAWAVSVLDKSAGLQKFGAIGFGAYLSTKATNPPARVRLLDLKARPV